MKQHAGLPRDTDCDAMRQCLIALNALAASNKVARLEQERIDRRHRQRNAARRYLA